MAPSSNMPAERLSGFESLLVDPGDIILAMDRPVVSAGLKLARVKAPDVPALLVQRVARIRARDVNDDYLYYALHSRAFLGHLRGNEVGTQLPHITLKSIRDYRLAVPPAAEQRRIVEILEDHLSRLDAAERTVAAAARRLELWGLSSRAIALSWSERLTRV